MEASGINTIAAVTKIVDADPRRLSIILSITSGGSNVQVTTKGDGTGKGFQLSPTFAFTIFTARDNPGLCQSAFYVISANCTVTATTVSYTEWPDDSQDAIYDLSRPLPQRPAPKLEIGNGDPGPLLRLWYRLTGRM